MVPSVIVSESWGMVISEGMAIQMAQSRLLTHERREQNRLGVERRGCAPLLTCK
jgi:hypothetical protein